MTTPHPAKFSDSVLDAMVPYLRTEIMTQERNLRLLDNFAGVGKVHDLTNRMVTRKYKLETVGIELEPEWANQHPRTLKGNALSLPFPDSSFDVLAVSPCYGNRMADHHNATDASERNTYKHKLGRDPHEDSSTTLHWGKKYREFHELAWDEARRVLKPNALVLLNLSNHLKTKKKGEPPVEQPVVEWHLKNWLEAGAFLVEAMRVRTPRQKHGANADVRVDREMLLVLRYRP